MYHPRTIVTIWYDDEFGIRWEHPTRWNAFKADAAEILEKYIDKHYKLFYTINDSTYELDYYNFGYRDDNSKYY